MKCGVINFKFVRKLTRIVRLSALNHRTGESACFRPGMVVGGGGGGGGGGGKRREEKKRFGAMLSGAGKPSVRSSKALCLVHIFWP